MKKLISGITILLIALLLGFATLGTITFAGNNLSNTGISFAGGSGDDDMPCPLIAS